MNYKDIINHIKQNELKKIYLFYGVEKYLSDWIISEIKNKYIDKTFESLNYITMDGMGCSIKDIINACETLPFMSDKKLVIVENPSFLAGSSQNDSELVDYIDNLNDMTCLILTVDADKIDKRKKIVKKIASVGSIVEFGRINGEELNKWIAKMFNKYGKKVLKTEIDYFIINSGYLESNGKTLYDLENEIIKIISYIGHRTEITQKDIDEVLAKSLQNNIFKLVDNIGQKNIEEALSILNEMLISNEPVQLIFFMVIRQFRLLLMAKLLELKGYSVPDIAKKMNVPNFVAKKVLEQSRNFTEKRLEEGMKECLRIDENIKTGNIDNRLALEMLLVNFIK